eukprot:4244839-Pleurochrysis_carterae.AAC.7
MLENRDDSHCHRHCSPSSQSTLQISREPGSEAQTLLLAKQDGQVTCAPTCAPSCLAGAEQNLILKKEAISSTRMTVVHLMEMGTSRAGASQFAGDNASRRLCLQPCWSGKQNLLPPSLPAMLLSNLSSVLLRVGCTLACTAPHYCRAVRRCAAALA